MAEQIGLIHAGLPVRRSPSADSWSQALLLSLNKYCPNGASDLRSPTRALPFVPGLIGFLNYSLSKARQRPPGASTLSPILLQALESGASECLWMDTDVLVSRDPRQLFDVSPGTIVVTQDPWEYDNGSTHRAKTWNRFRSPIYLAGKLGRGSCHL